MHRAKLEALRELYDEWAAGKFVGLEALLAPDVLFL
jgi:hypothetical protein